MYWILSLLYDHKMRLDHVPLGGPTNALHSFTAMLYHRKEESFKNVCDVNDKSLRGGFVVLTWVLCTLFTLLNILQCLIS